MKHGIGNTGNLSEESPAKKITVVDTTLRDGHQQPGLAFTKDDRIRIARALESLNVDVIEAGFPANPPDFEAIYEISGLITGPKISAFSRVTEGDIDAAAGALAPALERGNAMLNVSIATSEKHMEAGHRKSKAEIRDMVESRVSYGKEHFSDVQFLPEDATRTDPDFLHEVIRLAIGAGASRIAIADTTGYMQPGEFGSLVREVFRSHDSIGKGDVILGVHCHNDLGHAASNTLEGLLAGATQFEGTINGIGERAGNADLVVVTQNIMKSPLYKNLYAGIKMEKAQETADLVDEVCEMPPYSNRPVTGRNAYRHSSGMHTSAIQKDPETYQSLNPSEVGRTEEYVFGATSGTNLTKFLIGKFGYEASDGQIHEITEHLKKESSNSKDTFEENECHVMIGRYLKRLPEEDPLKLADLEFFQAEEARPMARVNLLIENESKMNEARGDGPVDAFSRALLGALPAGDETRLVYFETHPVSIKAGSAAIMRTSLALEYNGRVYYGRARSSSIIRAAVDSMMKAANSIYLLDAPSKK